MKEIKMFLALFLFMLQSIYSQDLQLGVHVLPPAQLGDNAIFGITVGNTGKESVEGVVVQITLENGVTYVSMDPTDADFDVQTGVWHLGSLYRYQARVLSIVTAYKTKENARVKAEIIRSLSPDPDSTPGNGIDTNDNGEIVHDKGDEDDGDAAEIRLPY